MATHYFPAVACPYREKGLTMHSLFHCSRTYVETEGTAWLSKEEWSLIREVCLKKIYIKN